MEKIITRRLDMLNKIISKLLHKHGLVISIAALDHAIATIAYWMTPELELPETLHDINQTAELKPGVRYVIDTENQEIIIYLHRNKKWLQHKITLGEE